MSVLGWVRATKYCTFISTGSCFSLHTCMDIHMHVNARLRTSIHNIHLAFVHFKSKL